MTDLPTKKYPVASDEVREMLGLNAETEAGHAPVLARAEIPKATTDSHPADLPTIEVEAVKDAPEPKKAHTPIPGDSPATTHFKLRTHSVSPESVEEELIKAGVKEPKSSSAVINVIKTVLPYLLVFGVGLLAYFFYFSKVDFSKLFQKKPKTITQVASVKETILSQLEKQDQAGYQAWVNQFYFDVSDQKIIDPEADNSGNGLSNFQKYLLKLNPKSYDTLGLGMADSEAIAKGINPLTGNPLTDSQKLIIDKYFDMEVITNRLTLSQLHKAQVAGNQTGQGSNAILNGQQNTASNTGQNTSTQNTANISGQNNQNTGAQNNNFVAPLTGADVNSQTPGGGLQTDSGTIGQLEIPSLKISVPIIWSKDSKDFTKDLQSGVVHYPGTAMPGQIGTTYISGHSSNYAWAKGSFNQVFSTLGKLADNSSFKITIKQTNGQMATLHYVVISSKEYLPSDQEQFRNTGKSTVALSTCWPVGSTAKRLVVVGELTQVEK